MRSYTTMRDILALVGRSDGAIGFASLMPLVTDGFSSRKGVAEEVGRLQAEGLVEGDIEFDGAGVCLGGSIRGLTPEGRAFLGIIENENVWKICLKTLSDAGVDLSYPLLKDVCETIVKRYVERFIPKDLGRRTLS